MASLKDIKRHIVAVRQTQKLTKAMNMVAAAKLRATQSTTEHFQNYANEYARLTAEIGRRSRILANNIIKPPVSPVKSLIVVYTSDRGLCGSFNSNIFNLTDRTILETRAKGLEPELFVLGKKGIEYYQRRNVTIHGRLPNLAQEFSYRFASNLTSAFVEAHSADGRDEGGKAGGYKEISVIYTKFETVSRHYVTSAPFLPLADEAGPATGGPGGSVDAPGKKEKEKERKLDVSANVDYLVEPDAEALLKLLIPQSLTIKLYRAYLESVTSENAARMQAMDNASKSCKDIISGLTLSYNKARQSAVTNELLDIVNGAEALKG
ncbi:MAG: ATP synthase F1 subunit gamma [Deltaproteobacteria bacterium]|jgi:F-type H+-transporting ATPase subunit gamma|nr:ATP synthase F1 subunit gamma [Deltaproteobacteria bacterium]